MRNFGSGENEVHMGEDRLKKLFEIACPTNGSGTVLIEEVVKALSSGW
jgi:hypothetical protein